MNKVVDYKKSTLFIKISHHTYIELVYWIYRCNTLDL